MNIYDIINVIDMTIDRLYSISKILHLQFSFQIWFFNLIRAVLFSNNIVYILNLKSLNWYSTVANNSVNNSKLDKIEEANLCYNEKYMKETS